MGFSSVTFSENEQPFCKVNINQMVQLIVIYVPIDRVGLYCAIICSWHETRWRTKGLDDQELGRNSSRFSSADVRIFRILLHLPQALPNSLKADLGTGLKIL